jgi:hypothetical protein
VGGLASLSCTRFVRLEKRGGGGAGSLTVAVKCEVCRLREICDFISLVLVHNDTLQCAAQDTLILATLMIGCHLSILELISNG